MLDWIDMSSRIVVANDIGDYMGSYSTRGILLLLLLVLARHPCLVTGELGGSLCQIVS